MAFVSFIEATTGIGWEQVLQCAIVRATPASFSPTQVFTQNTVYKDQLLKLSDERWLHQYLVWGSLGLPPGLCLGLLIRLFISIAQ